MTQVWDTCLYDGGTLLVLLAMADWANDDGSKVHPSMDTLAAKCRLTPRGAQFCVKRLRDDKVIKPVENATGGRSKVTEYKIDLERVNFLRALHEAEFLANPEDPKGCNRCRERFEKGELRDKKGCNLQHTKDEARDAKGEDGSSRIDNHQEPSVEPSLNRHSLAEREKGPSTVVEERKPEDGPDPKAWSHEAMVAYWELPAADRAAPEHDAEKNWLAIPWDERPTTDELIDCIRAWRADLLRINAGRPPDKPQMVRYLGNWIKDRSYGGFLDEVRAQPKRVAAKVAKAAGVEHSLDDAAFEALKGAGIDERDIVTWFADAEVLHGPPASIIFKSPFKQDRVIERYMTRLRKAFGEDVSVGLVGDRAA